MMDETDRQKVVDAFDELVEGSNLSVYSGRDLVVEAIERVDEDNDAAVEESLTLAESWDVLAVMLGLVGDD